MNEPAGEVAEFAAARLGELADPERAASMAAYMKTEMPFFGVQKADIRNVLAAVRDRYPISGNDAYRAVVLALWTGPHREEKYLAISLAGRERAHIVFDNLDLYEKMIVEGAWWDLVDDVAIRLVGQVVLDDRERMRPVLEDWIDHPDLWLRRSALICHIKHREQTDRGQLFHFCLRRAGDRDFFIRKAIGWSLREYAKTEPEAVRRFALDHRRELSGLSFREATKHLDV